ncbi:MAG: HlyD family efflux transporter periplasmic adaptor subunit [Lawsonibacter sp.]|nr:HlyD family efflux transporter periplasmic adaptor subunit [Lawsonibacter sp.]
MPDVKDKQTAPAAQEAVPAQTGQETAPAPSGPPKAKKPAGKGRQKIIKRLIALGVAAAIFGGGGFALYRFLTATDEEVGEIFPATAMIGTIQSKVSGRGTARAKESAAITLTQSGIVEEVFVTGGQTVMAGDPLYTIYSEAAETQLSQAQEEMNKLLEEANNLTVRAPFSGKLIEVQDFQIDQQVGEGTKVATLVNDKQLKLSLYFSYAYENDIYVGQSVDVSIPAVMRSFTGRVDKINRVSFISTEGAVHFEVEIVFDNPGTLTAGMDASAVLTAADGSEIYPYQNGQTEYFETRDVLAKASGPVAGLGNLLDYANVSAGEALLYLGSSTIDEKIQEQQKKLDEAQEAMADFNAVAPIDGTVTSCNLVEGQEVKSGDTVIMISNNVTMLVTISVDDRNISFIKPGSYVDLKDYNDNVFQGLVTSIDMSGSQGGDSMMGGSSSGTKYPVTLTVDNFGGALMEGMGLQYSFVTSESEACVMVPTACVQYFPDMDGNRCSVVFVQREERPDDVPELQFPEIQPGQKRTFPTEEEGYYPVIVETGIADTQNVEIKSGVAEGDTVFLNYTLTDSSYG